jgi:5-methylcytosine-specific restriction protein A
LSLEDITSADAVLGAMREYDRIGRDAFIHKYHFGPSRTHIVRYGGREYDSKPILGAAHDYQFPELGAIDCYQFHGGHPTIRKLESLGFVMKER